MEHSVPLGVEGSHLAKKHVGLVPHKEMHSACVAKVWVQALPHAQLVIFVLRPGPSKQNAPFRLDVCGILSAALHSYKT